MKLWQYFIFFVETNYLHQRFYSLGQYDSQVITQLGISSFICSSSLTINQG